MLSPASAGPSTEDDLARLLELAGTPVRPPTPQRAPAGAEVEATSNGVFTPSVAWESWCQAEAGSTRPGAVESVTACKPGPAAAVHIAQGERRCEEPLRPLLAPGNGRPHRPAEHGPSDARQLYAAVCSSVIEATAATKPSRPERWRARVVAIALVAAVALAALVTLGSVLGARPAPPPEGFAPSSLEGGRLGSSRPPGVAAVRGGAGAPHAATGHSGPHSAHKRAGGGAASSPPPPATTAAATAAAAAATTTSSPLPQEARHGSSGSSSSNATTRHASGKASGHEAAHEVARAPGPVRGPASGSGAAPGQPVQREPHGEAKVAGAHAPRHKQEHDRQ